MANASQSEAPAADGADGARARVQAVARRAAEGSRVGLWRAELAARWSLLFPGSPWRDPTLYSHELLDDDFWILAGRWQSYSGDVDPRRVHPGLGWTQGHLTPDNPLGLEPETRARLVKDGRNKVLFFGDSYVGGHCEREGWIPSLLDDWLADVDVLHLGVGGYGTDQMHLLARDMVRRVDRPTAIVMGVMDFSLDRAVLGVRSYQKPLLRPDPNGGLEVTNVPIEPDPRRFFRRERPSFRSYVEAAHRHSIRDGDATSHRLAEKFELNRAILDANIALAKETGALLLYVLFHDSHQVARPDARGDFMARELEARGVPTVETADVLRRHVQETGEPLESLYVHGHHNRRGNEIVGRAIADALVELGVGERRHAREESA